METEVQSVHVTIIPNPRLDHISLGIRRRYRTVNHGEFYFLIKISDHSDASGGLVSNQANAMMSLTSGPDCPDNPGKCLELMYLQHHIKSRLAPETNAEWHALCAENIEAAVVLQERLVSFLNGVDNNTGGFSFSGASDLIANAVNGTRLTSQLVAGDTEARLQATKEPKEVLPEAYGGPEQGQQFPWVSIIVQPRIDAGGDQNWGFTMVDSNRVPYHRFQVLVDVSYKTWATAEDLVRAQYSNLCPDISYNAIPLDPTWTRNQVVEAAMNTVTALGQRFGVEELGSRWLSVQIPYDDQEKLEEFAEAIDNFHRLKNMLEGSESLQESVEELPPGPNLIKRSLQESCPPIATKLKPRVSNRDYYVPNRWLLDASHVAFACKLSTGDGSSKLSEFTDWIPIGPAPAGSNNPDVRDMPVIVLDGLGFRPTMRYVYHKKIIANSGVVQGDQEPYVLGAVIGPVGGNYVYRDIQPE
ncbi:hypothetical protein FRC12_002156 [Ceratobasidium sp. 428]|nr:hypothetical protein FRC09_020674 [Ceratobasidium sp. 395]KAG8774131.1 hypothetical protein FRC12_002156 [Ceratobasidium sp. 428]